MYGTYAVIVLAGLFIFHKVTAGRVLLGALTSTAIFFHAINFMCWSGSDYPQDFGGLKTCFAAGIPYLKGTLLGSLFYSGLLFGTFAMAQRQFPALRSHSVQLHRFLK